jgi:putative membrane protein
VSAVLCAVAYVRWKDNEIAMRHARPLPSTAAIPFLAASILLVSAVIVALELLK